MEGAEKLVLLLTLGTAVANNNQDWVAASFQVYLVSEEKKTVIDKLKHNSLLIIVKFSCFP
jgi:hypothetical protein